MKFDLEICATDHLYDNPLLLLSCQIRAVMGLVIQCTVWSMILAIAAVIIAAAVEDNVSHHNAEYANK